MTGETNESGPRIAAEASRNRASDGGAAPASMRDARPPAAPLQMPRQVLETPRGWVLRALVARLILRDA